MHALIALLSLICFHTLFINAQYSNSFAGPYEIAVKQIGRCANSGTGETNFDNTRISKLNRTTLLYSSNFSLPYGFSDDIVLVMSIYVFGNGGWKSMAKDREIGPACSAVKKVSPKLVKDVAKAMGTWPKLCPNPPGNYTIKDLALNMELEIPVLPYNSYMFEVSLNHKKKRTGCGKIFVDITPKKKKKIKRHH